MAISEKRNCEKIFLTALTFAALVLRISDIDSPLAGDEAISFNHYADLGLLELLLNYPDSNQHAFFSILSNLCIWVFGDHELVFRLPSLLAGVLVVPLIYYTGRSLGFSQLTSLISAFLLTIFTPHISYSQEGRGYALTVFLATSLIFCSIKILETRRQWFWGSGLILSAVCMVITIPSNAVFVIGAAGFCLAPRLVRDSASTDNQENIFKSGMIFYVISFLLIASYLLINLADIRLSAHANSRGEVQWEQLIGIAEFLVSPWGLWLYLFLIIGYLSNLEKPLRYAFSALFLLPLGLSLITGIVGFARIYIYFSPFLLMLISAGFVFLYEKVKSVNNKLGYAFLAFSVFGFLYQPTLSLANNKNSSFGNGYMQDAIRLNEFIKKQPLNVLPVIANAAIGRSILIHYSGEEISKRMRLFMAGKKIKKIIFFSKTGVPPNQYSLDQVFDDVKISIPSEKIKLVESFGSFELFEWDIELSRLASGESHIDYENKLAGLNQSIKTYSVENQRAVGKTSLLIDNPALPYVSPYISIVFPNTYQVDLNSQEGFVLSLFIRASRHKTLFRPMLVSQEPVKIPSAYLNPYLKVNHSDYENRGEDGKWEMVVLLSRIGSGQKIIREMIETEEVKTLIDGVQSYVIK